MVALSATQDVDRGICCTLTATSAATATAAATTTAGTAAAAAAPQVVCGTMGLPTCTVQLKGPDAITRVAVGVGTGK
jgi:hypothetical protein